ncbi:MAG: cytochrome b/b6 domain-containing protein [Rubrivivax sp.]|nr:cytochrome b/b6 domain-containing protein [Rubrivivax sp.]
MNDLTPRQRADLPTAVLHWGLVLALLVSVSTGWRIASLGDGSALARWVDALAVQGNVPWWHFASAATLVALVAAYFVFLARMGLLGRLSVRLASLRSADRQARWQALNKLVYWVALALLGASAVSGSLMYFKPGLLPGEPLASVHRFLSWAFVAYIALHVLAQWGMGGFRQITKLLTPRVAYGTGAALALAAGVAVAAVTVAVDSGSLTTLQVMRTTAPPALDGDSTDAAWAAAPEVVVHTTRGNGLEGGEVAVHVKALHDGKRAYLLFRWPDATRSQKHLPVVKTEAGWKLLHHNYFANDENEFYEDKFAVMLARSPVAGGNTVRLGSQPLAGKPGPTHGLGLHVTSDGTYADVWHWKSVRSGSIQQFDDNHFGPPLEAKKGQARYTGGYTQDPHRGGGFEQNFESGGEGSLVRLKYLPRDLAAVQARMKSFNPSPEASDEGDFAMPRGEVVPYSAAADAQIPVGTVLPSVVYDRPFEGDRGDVSAHARWKDGWWTMEASRLLDTGSRFDQPIADGIYLWVSVFDHSQVRHTRHVRPLQIKVQP